MIDIVEQYVKVCLYYKRIKILKILNKIYLNFYLYLNDIFKIFLLISSFFFLNVIVTIAFINIL